MADKVEEFKELFASFLKDYEKFAVKGNKTASKRARASMLQLSRMAKLIRVDILEARKEMEND